jgi:D-tyrosyl-tRNA(Tyr) deacylase
MRVVLQRVLQASVSINDKIKSKINNGLLVFLSIEDADNQEDIKWLSNKIVHLRIFDDKKGIMNLSVKEINGEILLISQFTLHADTKKGNRPSYNKSAKPETAIPVYEKFIKQLEIDFGKQIQTGEFGATMKISLINDGPVTIIIDTKKCI